MQKLVVVDYGMGNLRSVAKAFEFVVREHGLPFSVAISSAPQDVRNADRVVFPGQGAMPDCMRYLRDSGLEAPVREAAAAKPFFGVCVGMQMLFEHSEEGDTPGLGVFAGTVERFRPADRTLKVRSAGRKRSTVPAKISSGERYYFVHSYFCAPTDQIGRAHV